MKRFVLLPTNGLSYARMAELRSPKNRDLVEISATSFSTLFDYYTHLLANFCRVDGVSIEELYLSVVYFLYLYLFFFMFPHDDEHPYFPTVGACSCGEITKLKFYAEDLDYTYRNPFYSPESECQFSAHGINLSLRARKISDNIVLSYLGADFSEHPIEVAKAYISTSTASMTFEQEIIPQHEWYQALDNFSEDELMSAYAKAMHLSRGYCGLSRVLEYTCPKCKNKAVSLLFNDILVTSPEGAVPRFDDPAEKISSWINTARYRIASYDELMNTSAMESKHLLRALKSTHFITTLGGVV